MTEGKNLEEGTKRLVVDIGAGGYPFPIGLRQRKIGEDELYIAIEPAREKVVQAGSLLKNFPIGKGSGEAIQARGEWLPLRDKSASQVVIANLVGDSRLVSQTYPDLIESGLLRGMVTELFRVLKDDGCVLVVEGHSPYPFVERLSRMFSNAGFFVARHIRIRDGSEAQREIGQYVLGGLVDSNTSYLLEFRKEGNG